MAASFLCTSVACCVPTTLEKRCPCIASSLTPAPSAPCLHACQVPNKIFQLHSHSPATYLESSFAWKTYGDRGSESYPQNGKYSPTQFLILNIGNIFGLS